jgi:hypothetical protein
LKIKVILKKCIYSFATNSKSSEQHSKFHGVWGIREASFGNNGRTKTGIILEQHVIQ